MKYRIELMSIKEIQISQKIIYSYVTVLLILCDVFKQVTLFCFFHVCLCFLICRRWAEMHSLPLSFFGLGLSRSCQLVERRGAFARLHSPAQCPAQDSSACGQTLQYIHETMEHAAGFTQQALWWHLLAPSKVLVVVWKLYSSH